MVDQLVKEFVFLWNPKFHYRPHKSRSLDPILSQKNPFHNFYPIYLRYILILYSHPRLYLPSGLFPSGFPTKVYMHFSFFQCVIHVCLSHPHPNNNWCRYKLWKSSLCSFPQPPVSSFLPLRDQVSHPYNTRSKDICMHIVTFTFHINMGPCNHSMAFPRVAGGRGSPDIEDACEYIE